MSFRIFRNPDTASQIKYDALQETDKDIPATEKKDDKLSFTEFLEQCSDPDNEEVQKIRTTINSKQNPDSLESQPLLDRSIKTTFKEKLQNLLHLKWRV
jgi:hypothetical protein